MPCLETGGRLWTGLLKSYSITESMMKTSPSSLFITLKWTNLSSAIFLQNMNDQRMQDTSYLFDVCRDDTFMAPYRKTRNSTYQNWMT